MFKYCKEERARNSEGILPLTLKLSSISTEPINIPSDETLADSKSTGNVVSLPSVLTKAHILQFCNVCNFIGYGAIDTVFTYKNCEHNRVSQYL